MNKSTAAAAAGAVALATTGAVSALFLTVGAATTPTAINAAPAAPTDSITIEYVDENGNPVDVPVAADAEFLLPQIELVDAPAVEPIIETEYRYVTTARNHRLRRRRVRGVRGSRRVRRSTTSTREEYEDHEDEYEEGEYEEEEYEEDDD